jgi:hypothetical protein
MGKITEALAKLIFWAAMAVGAVFIVAQLARVFL